MKIEIDLFSQIVEQSRLHPQFVALRGSGLHQQARTLMNELFAEMGDPNRNFISEFQGHGFHSHVFELACFAYLRETGLLINRKFERPDFMVSIDDLEFAVESTTANPSGGRHKDISILSIAEIAEEDLTQKVYKEFPRRIVRLLHAKLKKGYHQLEHCSNKPIVLMVAPFFEVGSSSYSDMSLIEALFGSESGENPPPDAPLPFFSRIEASRISAVLYCNAFHVSKFLRMSTDFGNHPELFAVRKGMYIASDEDAAFKVSKFNYILGSERAPPEKWKQGITMFRNPHADYPLPKDVLPCTSEIYLNDGYVCRNVSGFHPLVSATIIEQSGKWPKKNNFDRH